MKDKILRDTNLWVYLYSDHEKSKKVEKLIEENFESIILSAQIIGELYNVLTKKNIKPLDDAF